VTTAGGAKTLTRDEIAIIYIDGSPAVFEPGKIVDGIARNHMTYHVRVPPSFSADKTFPALVILHGSNMNARAYVETIAAAWPKLADDYIVIGINGERRVAQSPADRPAFNYSGVNYMGKSKYKGYPGTDRESPGLIPEVIEELRGRLTLGKIFVGLWIQSEPSAFEDESLRAAQRRGAIAVVHGENDPVVAYSQGKSSFDSLIDAGFPAAHLFTDKSAGHMFARLPIEEAVRWLEQITSDESKSLVAFAEQSVESGEYRDALAAINRVRQLNSDQYASRVDELTRRIDRQAEPAAARLAQAMESATSDDWVEQFFAFRLQFHFAPAAERAMNAYQRLRDEHEQPATKLWNEARAAFNKGDQAAGYSKNDEIVQKYYASSWYRYAKPVVERQRANGK
jgi:predicted esterase